MSQVMESRAEKVYYSSKKVMTDDVLWFLRVMVNDIFKIRIIMTILKVLLVFHGSMHLVQLYYLISEPQLFTKYAPHFIGDFYAMAATIAVIWKEESVENMWNNFERWDISSAGPDQESQIQINIRQVLIFVVINTSFGFAAGLIVTVPGSYDEDFFLLIFVVFRRFPFLRSYSVLIRFFYKLSLVILCFTMLVYPYIIMYIIQHLKYQLSMHRFYILNIDEAVEGDCSSLTYQQMIKERLRFCTMRATEIMRWGHSVRRELVDPALFVMLSICGFLLLFSIVFALMEIDDYGYDKLLICWETLFSVVAFSSFATFVLSGETLESEVEKVGKEFSGLRWYKWNKENRKLLMMAEGYFLAPFKLRLSGKYAVNFDLAVAMAKGLYTITSVLLTAKRF